MRKSVSCAGWPAERCRKPGFGGLCLGCHLGQAKLSWPAALTMCYLSQNGLSQNGYGPSSSSSSYSPPPRSPGRSAEASGGPPGGPRERQINAPEESRAPDRASEGGGSSSGRDRGRRARPPRGSRGPSRASSGLLRSLRRRRRRRRRPLTLKSWRRRKIATGGLSTCSASGGRLPAPGPSGNDSGRKTGPREVVETSGGPRCQKIAASGERDPPLVRGSLRISKNL